jgi:hypothetical protein
MPRRKLKRVKVNDAIWETLKMTLILEDNEVNDSNEDVFFTPLNSLIDLKPTVTKPTLQHCITTTNHQDLKVVKLA